MLDLLGEDVTALVFDLHAWFKNHPCKQEDFVKVAECCIENKNEALFVQHVITQWLTLTPTLRRILERWSAAKTYFLEFLPQQNDYKQTLKKNERYKRISACFQVKEQVSTKQLCRCLSIKKIFHRPVYVAIKTVGNPLTKISP